MIFRYPDYYDRFACIADRCEDTCCAGWEIDIDDDSYAYYKQVPGEFGDRLRARIKEYASEEEDAYESHGFILQGDKRCPFLQESGLCEMYQVLGEDALCDVCTYTPRNILEYGGQRELAVSASCPEAGRLIFGDREPVRFVEREIPEELDFEETEEEMAFAAQIRLARDAAVRILQDREFPILQRIEVFLLYAEQVQKILNENRSEDLVPYAQKIHSLADFLKISENVKTRPDYDLEKKLQEDKEADGSSEKEKKQFRYDSFLHRMLTFTGLESIREDWQEILVKLQEKYLLEEDGNERYERDQRAWMMQMEQEDAFYEYEHLMVYYAFMCLARCVDDYDFIGKAKLCVMSFLMIRDMQMVSFTDGGTDELSNRCDAAKRQYMVRIYAKEVEHSEENLEALADEFLFEDFYSVWNFIKAL